MSCEILIKTNVHSNGTVDYEHPNPKKDKSGVYKKGYPVNMLDSPRVHRGFKEGLPFFCAVNVTDGSVADVEAMINSAFSGSSLIQGWNRDIDFSVVNNNLSIDGWRMKAFATNPGTTNLAAITQPMVENYLNNWNAEVFSTATNEVVFDVAIFSSSDGPGALQSDGFWGNNVSNVSFNEISYDSGSGEHIIEADYSLTPISESIVDNKINQRGGIVNSNTGSVVNFTIYRSDVFQHFQDEVHNELDEIIYRRQFRISESTVDNIITSGSQILVNHSKGQVEYRVLDVTLTQIQSFLINRIDEVL
jgi:hypothetical protein